MRLSARRPTPPGVGPGAPPRGRGLIAAARVAGRMRPFFIAGLLFVLFGLFGLLLAAVDYANTGGACLGGRACPVGYAGWYEAHVLIWAVFGLVFLLLGLWLLVGARRRRFAGHSGPRFGPGAMGGPYGPRPAGGTGAPGVVPGLRFCPRCGARNGPRFQFCHRCGAALTPGPATQSPPPSAP